MLYLMLFIARGQQQYLYFPLPWFGWVGLECGVGEPVLGHKDYLFIKGAGQRQWSRQYVCIFFTGKYVFKHIFTRAYV